MEELLGAFIRAILGIFRFVGEAAFSFMDLFVDGFCNRKGRGWNYTCVIVFFLFLIGITVVIFITTR